MHPIATHHLLAQHLRRIDRRITESGWRIQLHGTSLIVDMTHRPSGEIYRLIISAEEYPLVPVGIRFLPVPPRVSEAKWPFDGHFVFRTNGPRPFVCLSGIRTFVPEQVEPGSALDLEEIQIGAVLSNLDRALHDPRYQGPVYLNP